MAIALSTQAEPGSGLPGCSGHQSPLPQCPAPATIQTLFRCKSSMHSAAPRQTGAPPPGRLRAGRDDGDLICFLSAGRPEPLADIISPAPSATGSSNRCCRSTTDGIGRPPPDRTCGHPDQRRGQGALGLGSPTSDRTRVEGAARGAPRDRPPAGRLGSGTGSRQTPSADVMGTAQVPAEVHQFNYSERRFAIGQRNRLAPWGLTRPGPDDPSGRKTLGKRTP